MMQVNLDCSPVAKWSAPSSAHSLLLSPSSFKSWRCGVVLDNVDHILSLREDKKEEGGVDFLRGGTQE